VRTFKNGKVVGECAVKKATKSATSVDASAKGGGGIGFSSGGCSGRTSDGGGAKETEEGGGGKEDGDGDSDERGGGRRGAARRRNGSTAASASVLEDVAGASELVAASVAARASLEPGRAAAGRADGDADEALSKHMCWPSDSPKSVHLPFQGSYKESPADGSGPCAPQNPDSR
jgi:hypothetical protein